MSRLLRFLAVLLVLATVSQAKPSSADRRPTTIETHRQTEVFTSRVAFEAAAPGLPVETFDDGRFADGEGFTQCGPVLDAATSSACFEPGEILPGLQISTVGVAISQQSGILLASADRTPFPTTSVTPSDGRFPTVLSFPDGGVRAVGFDVTNIDSRDGRALIDVYDTSGELLISRTISIEAGTMPFFGLVADEDIGLIEINGADTIAPGSTFRVLNEVIDNVAFGPAEGRETTVERYASRSVFEIAAPGLEVETFEEGRLPDGGRVYSCGVIVDVTNDSECFEPGEILPGIRFTSVRAENNLVVSEGYSSTKSLLVNSLADQTVLEFPVGGVTAVGLDVYLFNVRGTDGTQDPAVVEVYAVDGSRLDAFEVPPSDPAFVGVTSETPIGRIVIDGTVPRQIDTITAMNPIEIMDDVAFGRPAGSVVEGGPADGDEGVPLTPRLGWIDFAGTDSYRVQVSEDGFDSSRRMGGVAEVVFDQVVEGTAVEVPAGTLALGTVYAWRVAGVDSDGVLGSWMAPARFTTTASVNEEADPFASFDLRVAPNPIIGRAVVTVEMTEAQAVQLGIYDVLGRRVAALVDKRLMPGTHEVAVDASAFAPGVYLVRFVAEGERAARRVTVAR